MTSRLRELEAESIFVIREAFKKRKRIAVLWSMGKDSTVLLHLIRKAFLGRVPMPVVHIDTSYKLPEMIEWRDSYASDNNLNLIVGQNKEALKSGMSPEQGRRTCCSSLKTDALLQVIEEHSFDGLILGIRGDEEGSRGKERIVSPRFENSNWLYKSQPAEIWDYYNLHLSEDVHVRIHPILNWTEMDVWDYIRLEEIEVIPLYYARDGKRFRSLGCEPCTKTVDSCAGSVDEIISELHETKSNERAGRAQDQEERYAMQFLRKGGYM